MSQLSPERLRFLEVLDNFINSLKNNSLVYEIGKSHLHDYKSLFEKHRHKTIDIDPLKKPDILLDVENSASVMRLGVADAVIMHGVYEQCNDPIKLIRGVTAMLRPGGKALFGLISVGFPLFGFDRWRITPSGVDIYLKDFNKTSEVVIYRGELPSYVFVTAEKKS